MVKMIDARLNETQYHLDSRDRVVAVTYPEGNEDRKVYNHEDLLVEESTYEVDRSVPGRVDEILLVKKRFEYDDLHRVKREVIEIRDAKPGIAYNEVETLLDFTTTIIW